MREANNALPYFRNITLALTSRYKCTPYELEELFLRSKLKCHTITSFGLFLFTNKLITMSKIHNSLSDIQENKDLPPPPFIEPGI